jgi:hypothetical protein
VDFPMSVRDHPADNRLANEASPYLRAHGCQPVDWYPWGPEALSRARQEGRPILLSIGYGTSHWCQVMARESFEDPATAALMNALFVNIKVDRDARPDLDRVYQIAQTVITQQRGGWPLTLFLSPDDHMPFFGGTYFAREARAGLPAFRDLLQQVAAIWHAQRAQIAAQGLELTRILAELAPAPADPAEALDGRPLAAAREALERRFERDAGGFSGAPKHPQPGAIERLLRTWVASQYQPVPDLQALYMATLTLTRMAEGGLQDHVGGGFARYSVDAQWRIPHFEKRLADNGLLIGTYAEAAIATGESLFAEVARRAADWALRDLRQDDGTFAAGLAADTNGTPGRYYAWSTTELDALPDEERTAVRVRYGLDGVPNFEGAWHLAAAAPITAVMAATGHCENGTRERLSRGLARLHEWRAVRERPALDEQVLPAANALMIRGLAIAARLPGHERLAHAATEALDGIRTRFWRGGVLATTRADGSLAASGSLDDHAFLADATLELLETRWRASDLSFAIALAEILLARFEDAAEGGFWFTAHDEPLLIHRLKPFADEAAPAGNGVAARVLLRLGHLLSKPRYLAAAQRTLRAAATSVAAAPEAHGATLDALEEWLQPTEIVVLRGPAAELATWHAQLMRLYAPRRFVLAIPDAETDLPQSPAVHVAEEGPVATLHVNGRTEPPLRTFAALMHRLRDGIAR